jgi:WD40 repeat protein
VLSAFPPAARLRHPVAVPPGSKTAIVDLSLPASATTQSSLAQMSAQLVWTLTSSSYGSSRIQAVKLMVNGRAWIPPGTSSAVQDRLDYPQPALTQPAHQNLYYLTTGNTGGAVRVLSGQGTTSAPLPGAAGTGRIPLSSIAVSPDGRYLAGVAGPPGSATLYTEDLSAAAKEHASPAARELRTRLSGVQLTAISWDRNDNLWVAGASRHKVRMWQLHGDTGAPVPVGLPAGTGQITAMRVAPDGVRMAMITSVRSKTNLALAAIARTNYQVMLSGPGQVGADLSQPSALSWFDPDHLLVVNQSRAGPQLMEVPVDGDRSSYQGIEPGMVSISAAGSQNSIFASLQSGFLAKTVALGELWNQFLPGRDATYPG